MARLSQWLCLFVVLFTIVRKIEGKINVTLTTLDSAVSKGAVCLDGSAPGYYYDKGHGEGVDKWVVFIEGGGWCMNAQHCKYRGPSRLGSSEHMYPVIGMGDMMSNTPDENPEFYNWHRVHVAYCDGSSFTSDVDGVDPVTNLTYRGARIFYALMEDFQAKGMKNAKNAIFAGSSAGGVAVMLHCDYFRALFPNTTRVKCLADSSYFINDEKLEGDKIFQSSFDYLVDTMGSAKRLPKECTSKMKASLCFFPQYSLQYVKTPIFLTMSAFDQIQLKYGLTFPIASCITFNNCTLNEFKIAQELRMDFLSLLPKGNSNSIAIWVNNCIAHEFIYNSWYGPKKLRVIGNKTYAEVFADWYFDRNTSPIRVIPKSEKPLNCSTFEANPRQP